MDDNPYKSPAESGGARPVSPSSHRGPSLYGLAPVLWFLVVAFIGVGAHGVLLAMPIKIALTLGTLLSLYAESFADERRVVSASIWLLLILQLLVMWLHN